MYYGFIGHFRYYFNTVLHYQNISALVHLQYRIPGYVDFTLYIQILIISSSYYTTLLLAGWQIWYVHMDPYKCLQTHRGKGKSRKWITGKKRDERNIFFFFLYVKEVGTMTTYSTFAASYSITIQPDYRPSPIRPEHSQSLFGPHKNELVQYGSSI